MIRRLLFASLALAPLVIVLHYAAGLGETTEFELDRDREKFLLTFNPSGFLRRTGG